MSAHTPGPWWVSIRYDARVCGKRDGHTLVADCLTGSPEDKANTRLIAAAPAMLEALFAADLAFAEHGILASHATRIQIHAAIKAAKGEA